MARVAPRTFKAVKPNRGIQARYRAVLDKFVDAMDASIMRFLLACYRRNEPVMAADAAPKLTRKAERAIAAYRKEGIFFNEDARVGESKVHGSAFTDGSIVATQNTVTVKGVALWKKRIKAGERPHVLIKYTDSGNFRIVDGHHRATAYHQLGITNIPVLILNPEELKTSQRIAIEQSKRSQRKERERVAENGLPADALQKAVRALARRWQRNMNDGAHELARHFSKSVEDRSSRDLEGILERSGISVKFTMTPAQRDVLKATVNANVSLIKSIPAKHFAGVEQVIMQGVQNGRDLAFVSRRLRRQFGITKRRAALIARDQNNKATSALTRARQDELGIREAIWRHSGGGKHPRRSHIAADGKKFDIRKGMRIDGEYIWPGELINCGCTSESVIPGI